MGTIQVPVTLLAMKMKVQDKFPDTTGVSRYLNLTRVQMLVQGLRAPRLSLAFREESKLPLPRCPCLKHNPGSPALSGNDMLLLRMRKDHGIRLTASARGEGRDRVAKDEGGSAMLSMHWRAQTQTFLGQPPSRDRLHDL